MQTKQDKNHPSPHEGSIPFTRYARQNERAVVKNVVKRKQFRRVFSRHADTIGLDIIRRVKWAVFQPRLSYWPAFFALLLASSIEAAPRHGKPVQGQATYDRAVNVTLDTVMWVHEQHRGKMTWLELNSEVCRHMKVRRTEPWARQ